MAEEAHYSGVFGRFENALDPRISKSFQRLGSWGSEKKSLKEVKESKRRRSKARRQLLFLSVAHMVQANPDCPFFVQRRYLIPKNAQNAPKLLTKQINRKTPQKEKQLDDKPKDIWRSSFENTENKRTNT